MKPAKPFMLAFFLAIFFYCSTTTSELKIMHQVTGPIETNCYLIFDSKTMEAAPVDVGCPIDTFIDYIDYLCTHNHPDHIIGVSDVRDRFPEAKTVMHKLDYDDLLIQKEYVLENADDEFIEWLNRSLNQQLLVSLISI